MQDHIFDQSLINFDGSIIHLIDAETQADDLRASHSLKSLFDLPVNCYLLGVQSQYLHLNDNTAVSCGFVSTQDALGNTIRKVAQGESANTILRNDMSVLQNKRPQINTEYFTKLDDQDLSGISIKFPLMRRGELIGLLGMTLLSTSTDNINSLCSSSVISNSLLMQSTVKLEPFQDQVINGISFKPREVQILQFLVYGYTAKGIGKEMGLSHRTIEHTLEKIRARTNCSNKSELIQFVINYFTRG